MTKTALDKWLAAWGPEVHLTGIMAVSRRFIEMAVAREDDVKLARLASEHPAATYYAGIRAAIGESCPLEFHPSKAVRLMWPVFKRAEPVRLASGVDEAIQRLEMRVGGEWLPVTL
jgi:hypothetical protein